MKKLIIALAAGFMAATASVASATPVAKVAQGAEQARVADVQLVHKRGYRHGHRHWNRHGHRHWKDRRYRRYSGWNRYYDRPRGWRARGCVAVGPVWFCP